MTELIDGIEHLGEPLLINGRELSLSRVVRAGDFLFLTGQIPMQDGLPMVEGSIEEQTRNCIEHIQTTLEQCQCTLANVVKTMVWLKHREDFPGFDATYREFFAANQPARSALVSEFLVDIKVEIECVAYAVK